MGALRGSLFGLVLFWSVASAETRVQSILPLQTADGVTFCTTFSINEQAHLWLTAGHCALILRTLAQPGQLGGGTVLPVMVWAADTQDLAVLWATVHAKALPLASHAPQIGDPLEMRGFPYGLDTLIHTWGRVAGRLVTIDREAPVSDVLDITGAPGNSGSPVLVKGKVVGLLWGGYLASEHSLSIPWETLFRDVRLYWDPS